MRAAAAVCLAVAWGGCHSPVLEDGRFDLVLDGSDLEGEATVGPNEFGCTEIVLAAPDATVGIADSCPLEDSGFPNAGSFVLNEMTRNPHSVNLEADGALYVSIGGTLDLEDVNRTRARGRIDATLLRVTGTGPDTLTINGSFNATATP